MKWEEEKQYVICTVSSMLIFKGQRRSVNNSYYNIILYLSFILAYKLKVISQTKVGEIMNIIIQKNNKIIKKKHNNLLNGEMFCLYLNSNSYSDSIWLNNKYPIFL